MILQLETIFTAPEHYNKSHPGAAALATGPTCRHQDAALGVHYPLTQRLRGEAGKLDVRERKTRNKKGGKAELLFWLSLTVIVATMGVVK